MAHKLDNPVRLKELNPRETLMRIGLSQNGVFCDIGAGTGIFTYAAAGITANAVYAVEISGEMRETLRAKNSAPNVFIEDNIENVPEDSCDVALLCTVLHELNDIPGIMGEIRRILKRGGILAVIEFHKAPTPLGPPMARRISETETAGALTENGFTQINRFELGENFYCLIFNRAG
ncbi:MAG: class I SAM-dependent methyltransferase [Candidatus Limiplasma sp.]|nr:class I SAM-dependent methyltransferase [Candidatus Limiplasma sp.]